MWVIHQFAHKLDMANGGVDGCPPLRRVPGLPLGCTSKATLGRNVAGGLMQTFAKRWPPTSALASLHPWLDA